MSSNLIWSSSPLPSSFVHSSSPHAKNGFSFTKSWPTHLAIDCNKSRQAPLLQSINTLHLAANYIVLVGPC